MTDACRAASCAALALAVLLVPARTSAFCRTTTCDTRQAACPRDADGCLVAGAPLAWSPGCLRVALDVASATRVGYDPEQIVTLFDAALARWQTAPCPDGGTPDLCLQLAPACGPAEAPIEVVFAAESATEVIAGELAHTTVFFSSQGVIERAAVVINAGDQPLTVGDTAVGYDLLATVIHELGHAIGIDHSNVLEAAMHSDPRLGRLNGRTLAPDDVAAVCAIYPARTNGHARPRDPTRPGELRACGDRAMACQLSDQGAASRGSAWSIGLALLAVLRLCRRHPRRNRYAAKSARTARALIAR